MTRFAIGVDLGGTNLRVAAVDDSGRLVEAITTETAVVRGRESVVEEMCAAIEQLRTRHTDKQHAITGIGIGVPGIIDMERGMVRESPNLPGWHDFPVQQAIEKRLGTHVVLENDANAAAFGEKWMGAGQDSAFSDLCMVTLGTGVGGGFVLNGKVHHGMTGMAAELGHTTVYPEGQPCKCGNRGCLEEYASATAVKRMALEAVGSGKAPELGRAMSATSEITAQQVFQLSLRGDRPATAIFEQVGTALGIALASWINALNLPMYVIGGGVAGAWEAFAPTMMKEIRARSFVYRATNDDGDGKRQTIVTRAVLGGDAGLLGAARLAMLQSE
ncbi:MAG TPA: ROK family protein [Terriglobales bacterium]|nr:ROK family protein [Terriglobales bacterium]